MDEIYLGVTEKFKIVVLGRTPFLVSFLNKQETLADKLYEKLLLYPTLPRDNNDFIREEHCTK